MASIHLSPNLQQMAEQRAAAAGYESVESYIASLIEADDLAPISSELEAEILKGLDSGASVEITPALISEISQAARRRRHGA